MVKDWVSILGSVHAGVREDMEFVEKKWLSEVDVIGQCCESTTHIKVRQDRSTGTVSVAGMKRLGVTW